MKELSEAEQAKTLDLCSLCYSKDTSGGEQKTKRLIFPQSQVMWRHRLCSVAAVCTWPAAHVLRGTGESAFVLLAWVSQMGETHYHPSKNHGEMFGLLQRKQSFLFFLPCGSGRTVLTAVRTPPLPPLWLTHVAR